MLRRGQRWPPLCLALKLLGGISVLSPECVLLGCALSLQADMAEGLSFDESWSALTLKACKTGQSHVMSLMLNAFVESVAAAAAKPEAAQAAAALGRLAALFGLAELQDGQQWAGLLDIDQMQLAERACDQICEAIRPVSPPNALCPGPVECPVSIASL